MRFFRSLLVAVVAIGVFCPAQAAVPDGLELHYRILRDGFEIGSHKVSFRHDDELLIVETEIRITVKLLFITLYSYRLDAVEIWRGDRLISLQSATDDDGDFYTVRAAVDGDRLVIDAGSESWNAPKTIIPSSLWHRRMAQGSLLMGVEQGEAMAVTFQEIGRETITAGGVDVAATKVVVSGELERSLWYDDQGVLVHLQLTASDGSSIVYVME